MVLACAALVACLSAVGIAQIRVSTDDLRYLPEEQPVKQSFEVANRNLGGSSSFTVVVDAEGSGLASRELLLGLERFEQQLENMERGSGPGVTNVLSILDAVRETNRALHGGDAAAYRIPETQRAVDDVLTVFRSASPDELARLATVDLRTANITLRVPHTDAASYQPLIAAIERALDQHVRPHARAHLTGTTHLSVDVDHRILHDLARSFGVAFVVVGFLMLLMLGRAALGAVAIVPNLLPIAAVLGVMGVFGIWLDYATVLVASIALGIVVDDTVHLMHHFASAQRKGLTLEASVSGALKHSGRAMVITTVVLACGLGSFTFSELGSARLFGLLVALTAVLALVADLVLLPALLRTVLAKPADRVLARERGRQQERSVDVPG